MEPEKRRPGRPKTGRAFTERVIVYYDAAGVERLRALADRQGVTQSELVRRLIEDAAKREGLE